jgi:hypothetical protein
VHQLNIRAIVSRLSAKPLIRVESGAFVGRFGDQEYARRSLVFGLRARNVDVMTAAVLGGRRIAADQPSPTLSCGGVSKEQIGRHME